ncbi:MAG TPA: YggT family protein [Steroidobacteraceae bacterium]|nr:YggT family protein [Steroidobacteraceae bacterium]HQX77190.1 YggT family protein [Steroidobacteraceae bacterium]HQZ80663.1 YggT family protein [Steroidobacteraceae bacterium]
MSALFYVVETLLSLVFFVFLLRLLLQIVRADFRNPISQAIVRLTNPLILPLRRVLPPAGKLDTASIVAVLLIAFAEVGILYALRAGGLPPALTWLRLAALGVITKSLWVYFYAILLYALISLISPGQYSPVSALLDSLCEPVLRPFRRLIPAVAGLDLSPLWALIALQALLILLRG